MAHMKMRILAGQDVCYVQSAGSDGYWRFVEDDMGNAAVFETLEGAENCIKNALVAEGLRVVAEYVGNSLD